MAKTIVTGYISDTVNGIKINSSIKCNKGNYTNKISRKGKYLVYHYTGNKKDNAKNNATYFKNNDVNVSAHFFVDDTSIYQSVELRDIAYHCGTSKRYYHAECRNENSIAIEMCCTAGNYKISAKTIENSAYLGALLCEKMNIKSYEVDTYVLRHYDITHKKCPAQMVDNIEEWEELKTMIKNILKAKEKKTTNKASVTTKKATDGAESYLKSLTGTYKTTANLNIRNGAGTNRGIMVTIPKGTKVKCYGYYTAVKNVKWLYIQFTYKNVQYTGFASSDYLKK